MAAAAVTGAVSGLAVATPGLARAALRARLDRLEARTGRRVTVGTVSAPLWGTVALRDVAVTAPDGVTPQISATQVDTDLPVLALALGRRRPHAVEIAGLRARLSVGADGLTGFEDLARPDSPGGTPPPARRPLRLTLEDAVVDVGLALPGVAMPGGRARVVLRLEHAAGERGSGEPGADAFTMEAWGSLEAAGRSVEIRAWVADGVASVTFAPALVVPLEVGGRRMVLSLGGITRDRARGEASITAPRVAVPGGECEAEAVTLEVDAGAGWVPRPQAISAGRVEGARGGGGGVEGAAEELRVARTDGIVGARVFARHVSLGAARWSATLAGATATLREDDDAAGGPPLARLRRAVRAVTLESPRLTLRAKPGSAQGPVRGPARGPGARGGRDLVGLAQGVLRAARGLTTRVALTVRAGAVEARGGPGGEPYGLRDVAARVRPSPSGATTVAVTAVVGRGSRTTGALDVRATIDRRGNVERADGRVRGTDLAHLLSQASDYVVVDRDTALDLRFAYTALPPPAPSTPDAAARAGARGEGAAAPVRRLRGTLRATDLGFQAWRISHEPVHGIDLEARFEASLAARPGAREVDVLVPSLRVGEAQLDGAVQVILPDGAPPRLSTRVHMARQDCAAVRRSIPASLIPRLRGLTVRGDVAFTARLDVDLARPKELTLRVDGDIDRCEVVTLGGGIDLEALRGRRYVHHPVEPERGRRDDIAVGPGTSQWVRSKVLPAFVKAAAIVTEDRAFTRHGGVRWDLVARALKLDLAGERFVYGGSTITQQLVKNLYLTREKTLARKLEEAIIAMEMERRLTKDQILTLYINVVEYGPDIYGVKRASRFYFGKQPWELSPLEAAFIMGLKPYPRAGFKQWTRQHLNGWWVTRVKKVLEMMYRREHAITWAELQAAAPYQPRFRPPGAPMSGAPAYVPPPPSPASADKR